MVNSLLGLVKDQLSDKMIGRAGSLLGLPTGDARSAVMSSLPAVLGGLGSKVATLDGAKSLLSVIKDKKLGAGTLTDMIEKKDDLADMGSGLASSIFGGSQNSILDRVTSLSGLGRDKSSKLLSFLTPAVMGTVGKAVSDKNLDAAGLQNLFGDYKTGLSGIASSAKATASSATSSAKTAATSTAKAATGGSGGGGGLGFLKWLLPLALLGLAAWWFLGRGGDHDHKGHAHGDKMEKKMDGKKMDGKMQKGHEGHNHAPGEHGNHDGHNHGDKKMMDGDKKMMDGGKKMMDGAKDAAGGAMAAGKEAGGKMMEKGKEAMDDMKAIFAIDADGNLTKGGKIIAKVGEFKEMDGYYVDASGKKLGLIGKVGKAIGAAATAAGGAVAGAAEKSVDAIKGAFATAFDKKDSGYSFGLSNIKWEEGGHKITSFSKNEVMGIAAALKANADGKIEVQVNGADKSLAKKRAQVIHDQLVTLGVANGQISAKGMGDGDAMSGQKVNIVVK